MNKKLILLFLVISGITKSQSDSSLVKLQKQIDHIQLNLERSHDIYTQGVAINAAGLMTDVIAVVGYKFDFMTRKQMNTTFVIAGTLHLAGTCWMIYSHKFIDKASLRIGLTGVKYNF